MKKDHQYLYFKGIPNDKYKRFKCFITINMIGTGLEFIVYLTLVVLTLFVMKTFVH